jgi:hypothetical protein
MRRPYYRVTHLRDVQIRAESTFEGPRDSAEK